MGNEILSGCRALHAGRACRRSFYLPLQRVKKWAWESYWMIYAVSGWIVVPWVCIVLSPYLFHVLGRRRDAHAALVLCLLAPCGDRRLDLGLDDPLLGHGSLGMADWQRDLRGRRNADAADLFRQVPANCSSGLRSPGMYILAGVVLPWRESSSWDWRAWQGKRNVRRTEEPHDQGIQLSRWASCPGHVLRRDEFSAMARWAFDQWQITIKAWNPELWQRLPVLAVICGRLHGELVWCVL